MRSCSLHLHSLHLSEKRLIGRRKIATSCCGKLSVQTMEELNIPCPHLAQKHLREVAENLPEKSNQSINQSEKKKKEKKKKKSIVNSGSDTRTVRPTSAPSPRLCLSLLTRSFLMINANSNDSSPVSCGLRCSAFGSRSRYKRRTSTAEVNNSTHGLNTQSRPHQTVQINESTTENPH